MAGVIDTTYTFTSTDLVTSTKLNNIIDQSVFTTGAVTGTTLTVTGAGLLKVSTGGITSNEIAANAVVTAGILDANVTTAKLADSAVTTAKLNDTSVTTAKLVDQCVTAAKIADGTITVDKLVGTQTGSAPIYGLRAWVVFSLTGGVVSVTASGNVASVTRTATGRVTVAFTTALPSANYSYFGGGMADATGNKVAVVRRYNGTKTASAIDIDIVDLSNTLRDFPEVTFAVLG